MLILTEPASVELVPIPSQVGNVAHVLKSFAMLRRDVRVAPSGLQLMTGQPL